MLLELLWLDFQFSSNQDLSMFQKEKSFPIDSWYK